MILKRSNSSLDCLVGYRRERKGGKKTFLFFFLLCFSRFSRWREKKYANEKGGGAKVDYSKVFHPLPFFLSFFQRKLFFFALCSWWLAIYNKAEERDFFFLFFLEWFGSVQMFLIRPPSTLLLLWQSWSGRRICYFFFFLSFFFSFAFRTTS